MGKSKLLCFGCLTIAFLGLFQSGSVTAFDGDGGFDGGFDDGGFDGGGFDDEGLDDGVDGGPDEMAEADEDDDGERDDQGDEDKDGHTPGHRGYGHHHGHGHHGRGRHTHIIYGWPAFGYGPAFGYTPPPYYGYPRGAYRPAQPPVVYIEKNDASRANPSQTYWYYCRDPEGYYPDVEECPDGWEQVARQPQQDNQE